jgi:hypothetical protein
MTSLEANRPACWSAVKKRKHAIRVLTCLCLATSIGNVGRGQPRELPSPQVECPECATDDDGPITSVTIDITPRDASGQAVADVDLPTDCNRSRQMPDIYSAVEFHPSRSFPAMCVLDSAVFWHPPLYFEDAPLERCGITYGCCPTLHSAVEFYGGAMLLPLRLWHQPPHSCEPTPPAF